LLGYPVSLGLCQETVPSGWRGAAVPAAVFGVAAGVASNPPMGKAAVCAVWAARFAACAVWAARFATVKGAESPTPSSAGPSDSSTPGK
jgi:hypothetical protein